jgi:hypothetical protein
MSEHEEYQIGRGSPFPGMDSYLEGELWQEFHDTFAHQIRGQLLPLLPSKYVALLSKRYVVDRASLGIFGLPLPRVIYPDVHVVRPPVVNSYYVFLSRFTCRPASEACTEPHRSIWTIGLREPLPTVPVPLLPPDPDVPLQLQAAVEACFGLVGYERLLDYTQLPPPPALNAEDLAWVRARVEAWKLSDDKSSC